MARKRRKLFGYSVAVLFAVLLLTGLSIYWFAPPPPDDAIKVAREKLSEARDVHAEHYASARYKKAHMLYDSSLAFWRKENQRFILLRDYADVRLWADSSAKVSADAVELALKNVKQANQQSGASIDLLNRDLSRIRKLYASLPLKQGFRESLNKAKMMLEESRIARNKGDYKKAEVMVGKARNLLDAAEGSAKTQMKAYFDQYQDWDDLYRKAIAVSAKKNTSLIVVEKLSHQLILYKGGKLHSTYKAEFGPNWLGDKNHQGDEATPEGSYLVTKKKDGGNTRYYKALLLNYPNSDDMHRYRGKVRKGVIPRHVDVGGLIEIHGHGGQGFNWTNGCVALSNKDMDVVYKHTGLNTPVIILGSLVPLEVWQKNQLSDKHE